MRTLYRAVSEMKGRKNPKAKTISEKTWLFPNPISPIRTKNPNVQSLRGAPPEIREGVARQYLKSFSAEELREIFPKSELEYTDEEKAFANIRRLLVALEGCDPCPTPPEKFDGNWRALLQFVRDVEICRLRDSGIKEKNFGRFVGPGWAFFDQSEAACRYRFRPPGNRTDAVEVILVTDGIEWFVPQILLPLVFAHPCYRNAGEEYLSLDPKDRLLYQLRRAVSLEPRQIGPYRVGDCAGWMLETFEKIGAQAGELKSWQLKALDDENFWELLAKAVDFGRHENAHRLFRDGRLVSAHIHTLSKEQLEHPEWMRLIQEAIRDQFLEKGAWLTPAKLRDFLGCKDRPTMEGTDLSFEDPRYSSLPKINWGTFKKYAKRVQKIGSDGWA